MAWEAQTWRVRKARTSSLQEAMLSAALAAGGSCPNAVARMGYYSAMDTSEKAQIVAATVCKKALIARGMLKPDRTMIVLTAAGKKLAESLIKTLEPKVSPEPPKPNGNGAHQIREANFTPQHRRAHRTAGSRRRVRVPFEGYEWVRDAGYDDAPPPVTGYKL
jgi:hypothetical protein